MSAFEAYLFGSVARGDHDRSSDTDVLLVYENAPDEKLQADARACVSKAISADCVFAEYSQGHLERLFAAGHLFAWHLHLEAKRIPVSATPSNLPHYFSMPAPYVEGLVDASNFSRLLASALNSVKRGSKSPVYEAGIAYVALRNVGMSLSATALGVPSFTRYVPFEISESLGITPPCSNEAYGILIAARHASQRGMPAPSISICELVDIMDEALSWTNNVMEATCANPIS